MDYLSVVKTIGMTGLVGLLAACASGPSVRPQLSQSTGAVRAADEIGAQDLPEASLHLKLARENLELGHELVESDEPEQARRALERAEMDAELAIALVKESKARKDLEQVSTEINELETEHN